jgi:(R,R)-butanediol dehydrogenase / meso-butanediol dehydrogenase / diacetyl reductase
MKLVNIYGPNDVRVEEAPKPNVGPRDVLLKVEACGICGSDLSFAKHGYQRAGGAPWPLGHEAAGVVVQTGTEVEGITNGLRAIINPMGAADNVIGNGGSEGAFADYLLIRNAALGRHLLEIPSGMSAVRAALVEPLAVALHGVNQANLKPGDKVVVFGAGPIGLGAAFWLRRRGVKDIVSVDLSTARLEHARRMGATATVNPRNGTVLDALTGIHGKHEPILARPTVGTDVFMDMAGGAGVIATMIEVAKFRARIILTAAYTLPVPLDLQTMLIKEMSLIAAVGYPNEMTEVMQMLATVGEEEIAPFVSHQFSFADFPTAFEKAKDTSSAKVMVVFS